MKTVIYTYDTRDLGCGCCSESANYLEIYDEYGREEFWMECAPTFYSESALEVYIEKAHGLHRSEFIISEESSYC